jgi:hypothetical protein
MKKILISITLMMCLAGCAAVYSSEGNDTVVNRKLLFEKVYSSTMISVYVDTETNVMYAAYQSGYGGGLTVMVDQDGKPRLWEE